MRLLIVAFFGLVSVLAAEVSVRELPLEAFFQEPEISSPVVSPSGRYLAALMPSAGRKNLVVIDLQKGERRRLTDMKEENVVGVLWKSDERLVFYQQYKGQERFGIFAVNRDGSNLRILRDVVRTDSEGRAENQAVRTFNVIDFLPDDPNQILVDALRGSSGLGDVHLLDINNERMRRVMLNPGKVRSYITDRAGVIRVAIWRDELERVTKTLYRPDAKSDWVELGVQSIDGPRWDPLGFDGDNQTLYVSSDLGRKTKAVYVFDFEGKKPGRMIVGDDVYDVDDLVYSRHRKKVVAVTYMAEKPKVVWLDADAKALAADIDGALPGTVNDVVSMSADESLLVIRAWSDRDAGAYHLLDAKKMEMRTLMRARTALDPKSMSEMRPIEFKARDGLVLRGYLTLPAGREPKNLPMIVHPHGGPYGPRDVWSFNPEVQFLANRGYAVLQINFRGSGGYGQWFEEAGYRQWGLKMQDDLSDGVAWAVENGFADPKRVGIYGASYGGYATLAGLVFTPELYQIGINYVGVSDIGRLEILEEFRNMPKPVQAYIGKRFLNPYDDAEQVKATSPINFIERIRVPSLHAYGTFDPRVKKDQGEVLAQQLKKHGKEHQLYFMGNEGHGFDKQENRLRFYAEMDSFLKRYFPSGRASVTVLPASVTEMPAKD